MGFSFFGRLVALVCLAICSCSFLLAADTPAATSSEPSPEPFVHSPDLFPILPWDTIHGDEQARSEVLESIAECNFTLAGFVAPEDLPLCEKLGLRAIMACRQNWQSLSADEIDRAVKEMVDAGGDSPAVLGYYLKDEPGSPAFPALAQAVAAVKKYAPGKLAYINLFPSYATVGAPNKSQLGTATYTEYLERFVNEVRPQFLSYDDYMVEYSDDLKDPAKAAIYYADLLEVRRVAQKYGLPFWNIVSCTQIRKQTSIPSPANFAFQAYTTLAAGGRGVSWYKYYQGGYAYAPIDNTQKKTLTWRYLQAVNHQLQVLGPIMNRLTSTGVFFTSPPPAKDLPLLPGKVVQEVHSTASPRGFSDARPPVMVGEFRDGEGRDCVMLVNLSLETSTNVKIDTVKSYKTKQVVSAEDGSLSPLDEENGYWLPAGQGVLIKLD